MNARAVAFALTLAAAVTLTFCGPQLAPLRAQPILTPPTREPTPDPNRSLPPLPIFNSTYTPPPVDPLSYDDPAMHFRPPDGWVKLPFGSTSAEGGESTDLKPVALFARVRGKDDSNLIVIATEDTDEDLGAFQSEQESALRQGSDTVFIGFHRKIALANGMPAVFEKINTTPAQGAAQTTRFEYLVVDGKRGIIVTYSDRNGNPDEKEAETALASLTVVVYPRARR